MREGCPSLRPRHASERDAKTAALLAMKRARYPARLTYYFCGQCGGYHLTRSVGGESAPPPRTKG